MMLLPKILIPAATAAFGLGLATLSPQDGLGSDDKKVDVTKTVHVVGTPRDSVEDALNEVYVRLRRIRAERLPETPKKLADDAAKLYRQALKAVESKEEAKAKALTDAVRELTNALELSLKSRDDAPSDPELPPPPKRSSGRFTIYRGDAKEIALPPAIQDHGGLFVEEHAAKGDPKGTMTIRLRDGDGKADDATKREVRIVRVEPDGQDEKRDVVVRRLPETFQERHLLTERSRAESARAEAVRAHQKVAETLHLEIEGLAKQAGDHKVEVELKPEGRLAVAKLRMAEANAKLHESLAGVRVEGQPMLSYRVIESGDGQKSDADAASTELKRAYEAITKARKEAKKSDDANYLDAARDLYNAARREAEAKRYDRAAALARAAGALTRADHALGVVRFQARAIPGSEKAKLFAYSVKPNEGKAEGETKSITLMVKPDSEKSETKIERHHVEVHKAEGDAKALTLTVKPHEGKGETKTEHHVEVHVADAKSVEGLDVEAAEDVQGIGVMISFEDGKVSVIELMKGGPAEQGGRIKAGDVLVGIANEKGAIIGFADKPLAEVTKLLRGPADSKVKVVVRAKGSPDLKVYEIARKKLEVPKPAEAEKPVDAAKLPPVIE